MPFMFMNWETYCEVYSFVQSKNLSLNHLAFGAGMVVCAVIGVPLAINLWRNGHDYFVDKFASIETIEQACESLGIEKKKCNIAFIGRGSTGVKSLVKAIAGENVKVEECGYGAKYESPSFPNSSFWKMSKFCNCSANQYFNQHFLFHFDLIVIVCQATLGQDEIKLLREAKERQIPAILVRSRCDEDFKSQESFDRITEINQRSADQFISNLSINFQRDLAAANLSSIPFFFTSSIILRGIIGGNKQNYHFQENQFVDEIKNKTDIKMRVPVII